MKQSKPTPMSPEVELKKHLIEQASEVLTNEHDGIKLCQTDACANCQHFVCSAWRLRRFVPGCLGECHAEPPKITQVGTQNAIWPIVFWDGHCKSYERRKV